MTAFSPSKLLDYDQESNAILVASICCLSIVCIVALISSYSSRPPRSKQLLPGPKGESHIVSGILEWRLTRRVGHSGLPLLGNLLQIPPQHSWLQFKAWADEYGPIFRLKLGLREHVVISSETIANDLLRERGNYYSSREQVPMAAELLSDNLRPLLLPYNGMRCLTPCSQPFVLN